MDVDTVEEEAANTDLISAREESDGDFLEHSIILTLSKRHCHFTGNNLY